MWFSITTADELKKEWLVSSVPTRHAETLNGRCFGYHLKISGKNVVYTGDTAFLAQFFSKIVTDDWNGIVEFFADVPEKIISFFDGIWDGIKKIYEPVKECHFHECRAVHDG